MSENNCIFCRIIAGEAPVSQVYEDALMIAFMTLEQPTGHQVIVVPKDHVATIFELSDEQASALMQATIKVARAVRKASNCDGLNLFQANGEAAQQDVFHVHMQIIPRYKDDTTVHFDWDITRSSREVLDTMADAIRAHIDDSSAG